MNVKVTSVYERNHDSKAAIVLNSGGARSSKSYSICQLFITKFINEDNKNFLITRKTMPALRITALKLFVDLLKEYGYFQYVEYNRTNREFRFKNNYLLATSLDVSTKIQSTSFNYIWMEEAEEFTFEDYITLKTRLSGVKKAGEKNQMFLSYNPKKENGYINKKVMLEKDIEVIKSSYKDNPLLNSEYIEILENLKEQSPDHYKIFTLGEYAVNDGIIFTNIRSIVKYPDEFETTIYGLDFGYNNPTALVKIDVKDRKYYLTELLYETRLTNSDLIERLKDLIPNRRQRIYCDSAEPDRIKEIKSAGFNAIAGLKNVKDGIDFVKRCEIFTRDENVNLNKEVEEYSWRKNTAGEVFDEPVKYNDHFPDAIRYGIYGFNRVRVPNVRWLNV